jgi:hypothetical protein
LQNSTQPIGARVTLPTEMNNAGSLAAEAREPPPNTAAPIKQACSIALNSFFIVTPSPCRGHVSHKDFEFDLSCAAKFEDKYAAQKK